MVGHSFHEHGSSHKHICRSARMPHMSPYTVSPSRPQTPFEDACSHRQRSVDASLPRTRLRVHGIAALQPQDTSQTPVRQSIQQCSCCLPFSSTGEKNQTCPSCSFRTSSPAILTRHRKKEHGHIPLPRAPRSQAPSSRPPSELSTSTQSSPAESVEQLPMAPQPFLIKPVLEQGNTVSAPLPTTLQDYSLLDPLAYPKPLIPGQSAPQLAIPTLERYSTISEPTCVANDQELQGVSLLDHAIETFPHHAPTDTFHPSAPQLAIPTLEQYSTISEPTYGANGQELQGVPLLDHAIETFPHHAPTDTFHSSTPFYQPQHPSTVCASIGGYYQHLAIEDSWSYNAMFYDLDPVLQNYPQGS